MTALKLCGIQRYTLSRIVTVNFVPIRAWRSLAAASQGQNCFSCRLKTKGITLQPDATTQKMFSWFSVKQFMHVDQYRLPNQKHNKKDKVPDTYNIIYERDITIIGGFAIAIPCLLTIMIAAIVVVQMFVFGVEIPEDIKFTETISVKTSIITVFGLGGLFFIFLNSFRKLRNRLVVRMYYDATSDSFLAILRKNSLQTRQVMFKSPDIEAYIENDKSVLEIDGERYLVYQADFAKFGALNMYKKLLKMDEFYFSDNQIEEE